MHDSPLLLHPRLSGPGRSAPRHWLAAAGAALVLAACGSSDDPAPQAPAAQGPAAGYLLVSNTDDTLVTCTIDRSGDPVQCETRQPAGLNVPGHLELAGSRAYVSNLGDHTVAVCELDAVSRPQSCAVPAEAPPFVAALGLSLGSGLLYASNQDGSITVCNPGAQGLGGCRQALAPGVFDNPNGTGLHDGRLFVANQGADHIGSCAIGTDGTLHDCRQDDGGGVFASPAGLTINDGRLFVTNMNDDSIVVCGIAAGGALRDCVKSTPPQALEWPTDIAVNGTVLYVSNHGTHTLAICRVADSGAVTGCEAGSAGSAFLYPSGLAFAPSAP